LVQVSLFDSAIAALANQAATWLVTGHDPQPLGSGHPSIVPYGTVYRAVDGRQLVLAVGSDRQFELLCNSLQRADWATDPRFKTNAARVAHRTELEAQLRARIGEVAGEELLLALERLAVPAGAVRTVGQVLSSKPAEAMILPPSANFSHAGLRTVAFQSSTWAAAPVLSGPPHLGEHQIENECFGGADKEA
jgi:crotonobetainyl-CoA:carnitine CoA-transferase CaiB-like acyl-CoA transferase